PTAEEAGVRLALHPDDPPVPMLGGVARLFCKPANFRKAYRIAGGSKSWALDLCLGCCSEMTGGKRNVKKSMKFIGPGGAIAYNHLSVVQGTVPNFIECIVGDANYHPAEVIALLNLTGFDGCLLDDHVPCMDGDSEGNHRGAAHAIGDM